MKPPSKQHLVRMARFSLAYGMGAEKFARVVSTPQQKITRKNALKLMQAVDKLPWGKA